MDLGVGEVDSGRRSEGVMIAVEMNHFRREPSVSLMRRDLLKRADRGASKWFGLRPRRIVSTELILLRGLFYDLWAASRGTTQVRISRRSQG